MLQFLKAQGFFIHHQKGSHIQLRKDDFYVTIPYHGSKILKIKTVISILHQSGIDKEYFLKHV